MGEIAELMINGFLCSCCGDYLDGEEPGFERRCQSCKRPSKFIVTSKVCIEGIPVTSDDLGAKVIYRHFKDAKPEEGTICGIRDKALFVKFEGSTGKNTLPEKLTWLCRPNRKGQTK